MNRKTKTAADRIIARLRAQKGARVAAQLAAIEAARQVAHAGWEGAVSGVMQTPGDTAEERAFNIAQIETFMEAWLAFCHGYSATKTELLGPSW